MSERFDNDTRGWIMTLVSGIACVLGSSIIAIDILVRLLPRWKSFRIQDSGPFLAASMSLSFGVMLFSALYGILPSSKKYLIRSGFTSAAAAWILLAGFLGGFIGIQILSRFLHHYIPEHAVDCGHTHEEGHHEADHAHGHKHANANHDVHEATPLLSTENGSISEIHHEHGHPDLGGDGAGHSHESKRESRRERRNKKTGQVELPSRRPSMMEVQKRVMSFVTNTKPNCDSQGPCYGYSDPCSQTCIKGRPTGPSRIPSYASSYASLVPEIDLTAPTPEAEDEPVIQTRSRSHTRSTRRSTRGYEEEAVEFEGGDIEAQHHHHVPENEFLSISLQTSIAIALHKLPEGFITYATNHANPSLGFSVFMALFVHNITEGFALALPLYLALNSRLKAMFWASLLGGVSQPLGAGIAAAWFKIAGRDGHQPGEAVYGVMFAITAGIMTSVALQLFVEGLSLNHSRNLCIAFGFIGMGMMGVSNALTS